jgi:hypothetical protein
MFARYSGPSHRNTADLAGACSCGTFFVSRAGEAYDVRARNSKLHIRQKERTVSILTVFSMPSMNAEKYNRVIRDLEAAGQGNQRGACSILPPAKKTEGLW